MFVLQMKAGLVMCLITNVMLMVSINTWGYAFFDLGTWPSWAPMAENCTTTVASALTTVAPTTPII